MGAGVSAVVGDEMPGVDEEFDGLLGLCYREIREKGNCLWKENVCLSRFVTIRWILACRLDRLGGWERDHVWAKLSRNRGLRFTEDILGNLHLPWDWRGVAMRDDFYMCSEVSKVCRDCRHLACQTVEELEAFGDGRIWDDYLMMMNDRRPLIDIAFIAKYPRNRWCWSYVSALANEQDVLDHPDWPWVATTLASKGRVSLDVLMKYRERGRDAWWDDPIRYAKIGDRIGMHDLVHYDGGRHLKYICREHKYPEHYLLDRNIMSWIVRQDWELGNRFWSSVSSRFLVADFEFIVEHLDWKWDWKTISREADYSIFQHDSRGLPWDAEEIRKNSTIPFSVRLDMGVEDIDWHYYYQAKLEWSDVANHPEIKWEMGMLSYNRYLLGYIKKDQV